MAYASNSSSSGLVKLLKIQQVDSARLCLVRDVVYDLYKVNIVQSDVVSVGDRERGQGAGASPVLAGESAVENGSGSGGTSRRGSDLSDEDKLASSSSSPGGQASTKQDIHPVTLRFEGSVSVENIEKAENFARTHLLPGTEYTQSCHQLENQQEFNMVLESSHDIQRTTTALLTFNPDCLEVTLQGPAGTVASSRSKVVMILDKLREETGSDNRINADNDFHGQFYENLLLDTFLQKENSNSSELGHILLNGSHPAEVSHLEPNDNVKSCTRPQGTDEHRDVFQNQIPNWHLTLPQSGSFGDIQTDTTPCPVESAVVRSIMPDNSKQEALRPMRSVSDDESVCEDSILTDMRYCKKVEQALKLGYSEKHVSKALSKLGPDCALNDLLSELIQLGTSDIDSLEIMSVESDAVFADDGLDFGNFERQKLNVMKLECEESSSFSSSIDSYTGTHIDPNDSSNLRYIIIDGSNIAMSHGKKVFSCKGIQIAVDWFRKRGHTSITAFIPQWRKEPSRPDSPITDQHILLDLEKEGVVVFTPSRRVNGRRIVCYDDRYVLQLATETDGIVVSNDVYRDLANEREDYRRVVEQRLLMYSFANDRFMPPEDPLGRLGPTLDNFLRKVPTDPAPRPQDCPYGKKCTYGNKCRFYHPERGFTPQKLITDTLKEQADQKLQERATRLSEIAEKAKRSKQKLSRTKSLTPWEPVPPVVTSQSNIPKNKQEKPKLTHSKSVMLPLKSSDYLNEPRKKLEEAELARALEQISQQQLPTQSFPCGSCDRVAKSKSPSPRSSPSPQKDLLKQAVSSVDSIPRNPQPGKSMNTVPSRASPSHLTVPKPEPPERYLSGHLYLAKKLSDESVESSFFSEHTSSPSSIQTPSPVVPANKNLEQTQFPAEAPSMSRRDEMPGLFAFPPPLYLPVAHQQPPVYEPRARNQDLEHIPNLSIFEHGISQYSHSPDTSVQHDSQHHSITDDIFQKVNIRSPDSGLYTSTESMLSPFSQPEYPLPKTYSLFRTDQPVPPSEHLSLRRAFSSTGNFRTSEDLHPKLDRRASGMTSSYFGDEQFVMKPQMLPGVERSGTVSFNHFHGLNRQNSSSDPQIHIGTGELTDSHSAVHSMGDPARNFADMYTSTGQYSQLQQQQQRQFEQQQQQQRQFDHQQQLHRRHQKQQQKLDVISSQSSQPPMGTWVEYPNNTNQGYRSSLDCAAMNQYNAYQNSALVYRTNHMSYPASAAGNPNMRPASMFSYNTPPQMPQPPHYQQHSIVTPTQHNSTSPSQQRRQSFPTFPTYHHIQKNVSPTNHISTSSDFPQAFQTSRSPPNPFILPEDAPILPEDPRFIIYYHLSSVFTEQVVRRVMNLHPSERSAEDLCKLIIQYKDKTGL